MGSSAALVSVGRIGNPGRQDSGSTVEGRGVVAPSWPGTGRGLPSQPIGSKLALARCLLVGCSPPGLSLLVWPVLLSSEDSPPSIT